MNEIKRYSFEKLKKWCQKVFEHFGLDEESSATCAEVLISADLRGIDSHGLARLPYYIAKLKNKTVNPKPQIRIVNELASTALVDGDNGMGPVVGKWAMELAIRKAKETGAGLVSVRKSNHFGIAGYYSMMALEHKMIGLAMCNSVSMVSPTFGRAGLLGTNPISMSVPSGKLRPFVLDMATSAVPLGKIEIALRNQKKIPLGWAFDKDGKVSDDPSSVFKGGTLAPLGGTREFGGHKGYGLALMVDILSAILSNANYGAKQEGLMSMRQEPSNVGHFFMAFRIDGFRDIGEFERTMEEALSAIKESPKAEGAERIYIHGEPEFEFEDERRQNGIPLHPLVVLQLKGIGEETGLKIEDWWE